MIVTRADLEEGQQAVQSCHAAINFTFEHPSRAGPWFINSNYLALLEAEDEEALKDLISKLERNEVTHSVFREPDIGNEITAVAIEPGQITKKLTRKFPLLFKRKKENNDKQYQCIS